MSATTCTSFPILVNVTVPATWLPDFGSQVAVALGTSCACARTAKAHSTPKDLTIVFMAKRYRVSGQDETRNRATVAQFPSKHPRAGRAEMASASDVRCPDSFGAR